MQCQHTDLKSFDTKQSALVHESIDHDTCATWYEGRSVKVEIPKEDVLLIELGVEVRGAEVIESDVDLGKETAPQVQGNKWVNGTEC